MPRKNKFEMKKDRLTNSDISDNYNDQLFYLMLSDFTGAMAYWLAAYQHKSNISIDKPLKSFSEYMQRMYFQRHDIVTVFTYKQLKTLISEEVFITIPELLELNQIPTEYFYDLGALARNVFYMICREQITQTI